MFLCDAIIYQFTPREAPSPLNKHDRYFGGGAVAGGITEGSAVEELSDLLREM